MGGPSNAAFRACSFSLAAENPEGAAAAAAARLLLGAWLGGFSFSRRTYSVAEGRRQLRGESAGVGGSWLDTARASPAFVGGGEGCRSQGHARGAHTGNAGALRKLWHAGEGGGQGRAGGSGRKASAPGARTVLFAWSLGDEVSCWSRGANDSLSPRFRDLPRRRVLPYAKGSPHQFLRTPVTPFPSSPT